MEKTIEEYLADIQRDTKDIRQKQNIIFVEVLKRGMENTISWMQSHMALSIGIGSIGIALFALGMTTEDTSFRYFGIALLVFSIAYGTRIYRKSRAVQKSFENTSKLIDTLVRETEESFNDYIT